ncbi:MAG: type IX secretion system membrane protein PorP/SprF, partial [Bacteroidota bacterium]
NVDTYKEFRMQRHYIFVGGLKKPFNDDDYLFEPSVQIKASESMNMQIDANLKFTFNDNYWLGFSYRTNQSVVAMAGLATGRFYIGYAFDYNLSGITFNHSYGSHEIMAFVKLGDPTKRYRWKRRY